MMSRQNYVMKNQQGVLDGLVDTYLSFADGRRQWSGTGATDGTRGRHSRKRSCSSWFLSRLASRNIGTRPVDPSKSQKRPHSASGSARPTLSADVFTISPFVSPETSAPVGTTDRSRLFFSEFVSNCCRLTISVHVLFVLFLLKTPRQWSSSRLVCRSSPLRPHLYIGSVTKYTSVKMQGLFRLWCGERNPRPPLESVPRRHSSI